MADQPDPPDEWRVYEGDPTPDPEPEEKPDPPQVPYGSAPPSVPYGQQQPYNPVFVTTISSGAAPKLILVMVAVTVLGVVVAAAVAIFAAVDIGGITGAGSVDPKNPDEFAEMVEDLEAETGSTEAFSVGLYDGYAIIYAPVDDSTKADAWRWDAAGIERWTKSTSTDPRFDLAAIDPEVIGGMCDSVLEVADGATAGDCSVQIRRPSSGGAWFTASASNDYGQSFSIMYDKNGVEVARYPAE